MDSRPPTFVVMALLFFMSLGLLMIVVVMEFGPDPFRNPELVDCILRHHGKNTYVCPDVK
jgi:hypothetical protein